MTKAVGRGTLVIDKCIQKNNTDEIMLVEIDMKGHQAFYLHRK